MNQFEINETEDMIDTLRYRAILLRDKAFESRCPNWECRFKMEARELADNMAETLEWEMSR